MKKELIPVGDRVVVSLDKDQLKTDSGLYLPQGVKEKDKIQAGRVVKTGPGYPVPDPSLLSSEPWAKVPVEKYFPLQVRENDYCIFLKEQGIEISFEKKKYIVIPHSAILVLIRETENSRKGYEL
ncbi:MAG: co-chaperone GroES family protein [Candidatus Omnitrophica bacterium]|nr:co-chaperone GroES family protein [Candidatus Omnitrophota bacterium]MDD5430281.1 co-chaperone GroES family protein [Candidatus Omnitrophota bacterium]